MDKTKDRNTKLIKTNPLKNVGSKGKGDHKREVIVTCTVAESPDSS